MIALISYEHRSQFSYIYAYTDPEMSPFYSLTVEYTEMRPYYGLISNVGFGVPYVMTVLFAGGLTDSIKDTRQRAVLFSTVSIGWSLATFTSGYFDSFGAFVASRAIQGGLMAFEIPLG